MFSPKENKATNKIGNKFTFQAWNFVQAQIAITEFLTHPQKYSLTKDQIAFLESLQERLTAYETTFHQFAQQEIVTNAANQIDLEMMFMNYENQIKQGIEVIKISIENNILKYVSHSPSGSTDDDITDFELLLEGIKKCCDGVIKRLSDLEKGAIFNLERTKKITEVAVSFGAICVPFSQSLELLAGTRYENPEKIDAEYEGACNGYVKHWMEQIQKEGEAAFFIPYDKSLYEKHQKQDFGLLKFNSKQEIRSHIIDEMNKIDTTHLYIIVMLPNNGLGHGCGIRQIPGTKNIEFVDPNYGGFLFPNKESFTNWFMYLFSIYKLNHEMSLVGFAKQAKQPNDATSLFFNYQPEHLPLKLKRFTRLCEILQTRYENLLKSPSEMGAKEISYRKMLLDLLPSFLQKIETKEDCYKIKNTLEQLIFIFNSDKNATATIKSFFFSKEKPKDIWENNEDVRRLHKMLNAKILELEKIEKKQIPS